MHFYIIFDHIDIYLNPNIHIFPMEKGGEITYILPGYFWGYSIHKNDYKCYSKMKFHIKFNILDHDPIYIIFYRFSIFSLYFIDFLYFWVYSIGNLAFSYGRALNLVKFSLPLLEYTTEQNMFSPDFPYLKIWSSVVFTASNISGNHDPCWIISNQWIVKYLPIAYKWSHHILCNIVLTEKSHGKRVRESLNLIRTKKREKTYSTRFSFLALFCYISKNSLQAPRPLICEPRNFHLLAPYFIGPRISCFHFLNDLNCYN